MNVTLVNYAVTHVKVMPFLLGKGPLCHTWHCHTHGSHYYTHECHMNGTWMSHECHMNVTWMSHECHMNVTWMLLRQAVPNHTFWNTGARCDQCHFRRKVMPSSGRDNECGRQIDHRLQIGNTILAIKTDEYGHAKRDKEDEKRRYNEFTSSFPHKFVFIRFNPHANMEQQHVKTDFKHKLGVLMWSIRYQVHRIRAGSNVNKLEISTLFCGWFWDLGIFLRVAVYITNWRARCISGQCTLGSCLAFYISLLYRNEFEMHFLGALEVFGGFGPHPRRGILGILGLTPMREVFGGFVPHIHERSIWGVLALPPWEMYSGGLGPAPIEVLGGFGPHPHERCFWGVWAPPPWERY